MSKRWKGKTVTNILALHFFRIGLSGFENPMRDADTKLVKKSVGEGFKIKMDDIGNILIKRYGKSNVFVHNTSMANEETVIGGDILQMPNMGLTAGTSAKVCFINKVKKIIIINCKCLLFL